MATTDEFWNRVQNGAGGMFNLAAGLYGRNAGASEAQKRLQAAQGPLYGQAMQGASQALTSAGNMDPAQLGQQRFNTEQSLLAGKDAATEADLMRSLQAKGMLGAATYNPGVEGITPNGTQMNPAMAAYYAARNARDATMASGALDKGNAQLDMQINRAGTLQGQAAGTQRAGMIAQGSQPSRTAGNMQTLKSLADIGKSTGLFGAGMDWLKNSSGGNWLRNTFGGGGASPAFSSNSSDSIDW